MDGEAGGKAEGGRAFPYAAYFSEIDVMPALLMMPDEIPWLRQAPRDPGPHETVLYLGCQALKTPHFCREAIDVLESLGESVVTIGGPAVCCGSVHENFGHDLDLAEGAGKSTTGKLASFAPENVLTICPNCTHQYEHGVASTLDDMPFDMTHFYQHVHANRGRLDFRVSGARPRRVGLHRHLGSSHHQDEHGDLCAELLAAIPGVEVVELPTLEALGPLCYPRAFRRIEDDAWAAYTDRLFGVAREAGCDVVATIYHACQRELAIEVAGRALRGDQYGATEVVSVCGLLSRALGHPPRDDGIRRLKALGDVDAVMAAVAPNVEAHRIDPALARRVVTSVLFS